MRSSQGASSTPADAESDLAYVQDKGTLVVGITEFAPMDYKDDNGQWTGFDAELARLVAGQFLTEQQAQAVDPGAILAFFRSDLGRRLLAAPQREREYKFSLLLPAGDYYPEAEAGEEILLQGVVDCWFREADGTITVVDFKTDRVTEQTVRARAESYRPQLEAYTRALAAAARAPVRRKALWFFALGREMEL